MRSIDWARVSQSLVDVDDLVQAFTDIVISVLRNCSPCTRRSRKRSVPLPKYILKLIALKRKAWKSVCNNGDKEPYKLACSRVKNAIKNFYISQEIRLLGKNNKTNLFKYVNSRLGNHHFCPSEIVLPSGLSTSAPNLVLEAFSNEFSSNFNSEQFSSACPKGDVSGLLFNSCVEDVLRLLSCSPDSAAGIDGIPGRVLKLLGPVIAVPLNTIFQRSFYQSKFPSAWKLAIVQPVYKGKGNKSLPSSYRPVSLCSTLGKILERLAKEQLNLLIEKYGLLCERQHGFVQKRSTVTNLLEVESYLAEWDNLKQPYDIITFDFCRAFDKVPHGILMDVIASSIPLHQNSLCWIFDILSERFQCVRLSNVCSHSRPVTSGVVQGSALGPILFDIFINPLLSSIPGIASAFADDLKLLGNVVTRSRLDIQHDVDCVYNWSNDMCMPLSVAKCFVLHCGGNNPQWTYTCNNSNLPSVNELKDLGILRTSQRECSTHCALVASKAKRAAGALFRSFRSRDRSLLWAAFVAFVMPILNYASPAWCPYLRRDINLLEKTQRSFTKRLDGLHLFSYPERVRELSTVTLESSRAMADLTFTYKCLHGLIDISPESIGLHLQGGNTRGAGLHLAVPRATTSRVKSYFKYRLPVLWNALPLTLLSSTSLNSFRRGLRVHYRALNELYLF